MPLPPVAPQGPTAPETPDPALATALTPRQIVAELDQFIIGQDEAKRMVAIAMRNRWRRRQLPPELRDEIAPKNIIMMGPTGVGKTEIARRLAKLSGSPFHKVEATKFTEVGYVGRDVESMVRELMDIGVNLVRQEETARVDKRARELAEERLLDLLLPGGRTAPPPPADAGPAEPAGSGTRDKLRELWWSGKLDDREVEIQVAAAAPQVEMMAMPGMEDMGHQFKGMFGKMFPGRRKLRKVKVPEAFRLLTQEESEKLIDMDKVVEAARERVEQTGILFIDEIDKICGQDAGQSGPNVSREGVQRDLLPIVEGSAVNTKHGLVKTDHILFIGAGAFHKSKPSDLMPELQGRFPLRVELTDLTRDDFYRILTEPKNALTKQYAALMGTEGVELSFTEDGLTEIARVAEEVNRETENIGARRLYTILERVLTELSYNAPETRGQAVTVDAPFVQSQLGDLPENRDLSRYIL